MKTCPNCHAQLDDNTAFCPNCGASASGQPAPAYQQPQAAYVSPWDHTADYDPEDIKQNRLYALICYLIPIVGVIITLLAAPTSPYARYHVRQALRFLVLETLVTVVTGALFWTIIVPILSVVASGFILVVKIIAICDVLSNKVKEPWMIRSFGFLR